jgi:hypothetical protein
MSAREREHPCSGNRPGSEHPPDQDRKKKESLGKRFRASFKNMFTRQPVDETAFDRIQNKHWSDE